MQTWEIVVHRTLYVSIELEAANKEEAEAIARKQIENDYEDIDDWNDYNPPEIEYEVIPGDPPKRPLLVVDNSSK